MLRAQHEQSSLFVRHTHPSAPRVIASMCVYVLYLCVYMCINVLYEYMYMYVYMIRHEKESHLLSLITQTVLLPLP